MNPQATCSSRSSPSCTSTSSTPPVGLHQPSTLHPQPYILHPTPYTLNPTLSTLNPTPSTQHPTPYTLNPMPYTLHPTPSTRNATPGGQRRGPSSRGRRSGRAPRCRLSPVSPHPALLQFELQFVACSRTSEQPWSPKRPRAWLQVPSAPCLPPLTARGCIGLASLTARANRASTPNPNQQSERRTPNPNQQSVNPERQPQPLTNRARR